MQGKKRVYTSSRTPGKWLSYLMLFLSAVILFSGLARGGGGEGDGLTVAPIATATPIPTDELFDETSDERELTLQTRSWYALQLGVFEAKDSAAELADGYRTRGAAGYVWLDGRYRVLAALYPTREDAQNVREQLHETHDVDSYLYQIDLPGAVLRLSGMRGQLDMLEAAFTHADDLIARLQELSVALDRCEIGVPEAIETLNALSEQVGTVALRLRQRFVMPRHACVQGFITCFEQYAAFAGALGGESVVLLATKVKYQTFSTLEMIKQVYDAFGDT